MSGTYINGFVKDMPVRKKDFSEIEQDLKLMTSSFGRVYLKKMGYNVESHRSSIQGTWTENLWNKYPFHELEKREPLPEFLYNNELLKVKKKEEFYTKDELFFNENEKIQYRDFDMLKQKDIAFNAPKVKKKI